MTTAEIDSKKRKRKHKSKKDEEVAPVEAPSNGVAAVDKPRKKSKKVHTPEPEVEDAVAGLSENGVKSGPEDEEEQLNEELKYIAADSNAAEVDETALEHEQEDTANGANMEPLGLPSGTSMPTMDDPQRFDELNLSDRTMEAIKTMGFENMTEIQRKAIPPLLRYAQSTSWQKGRSNIA
jgi:ATP-dependent RNA helicase DDX18/HAS1